MLMSRIPENPVPSHGRSLPTHGVNHSRRSFIIAGAAVVVVAAAGVADFLLIPHGSSPANPAAAKTSSTPTGPKPSATPTPTPTPTFDKSQFSLTDPSSDWVFVNKQNPLNPKNYAPPLAPLNLPGVKGSMRPEAAAALQSMFADYHAQSPTGDQLSVVSPYRSYGTQVATYNGWVSRLGQAQADRQSARAGYSEHQTGLAVDIDTAISESFGATPAGLWLAANSWRYGFIVRYPQGQEAVTGYEYEPWHFRYLGVPLATEMHNTGATSLEAFFGYPPAPNY
jgi:D-alanyl-D-alanine carboxypeptidase